MDRQVAIKLMRRSHNNQQMLHYCIWT